MIRFFYRGTPPTRALWFEEFGPGKTGIDRPDQSLWDTSVTYHWSQAAWERSLSACLRDKTGPYPRVAIWSLSAQVGVYVSEPDFFRSAPGFGSARLIVAAGVIPMMGSYRFEHK